LPKCGRRMLYAIGRLEVKTGNQYDYTKCATRSATGEKCPQRGVKLTTEFYDGLYNAIINSYLNLDDLRNVQAKSKLNANLTRIEALKQEIAKEEAKLERIEYAYEEGEYSLEVLVKRRLKPKANIEKLNNEISRLEKELSIGKYSKEELGKLIQTFRDNWKNVKTSEGKNMLLKTIVSKIFYNRSGNDVTLEIEFL